MTDLAEDIFHTLRSAHIKYVFNETFLGLIGALHQEYFLYKGKKVYPKFEVGEIDHEHLLGKKRIGFSFKVDEITFTLRGPTVFNICPIEWEGNIPSEEHLVLMKLLFV